METAQQIITENLPHWVEFGGFGHFELTAIDFETQKFTIRAVQHQPKGKGKPLPQATALREFCCASDVASYITRKKVAEMPNIYGDEIECQKMILVDWCRKVDTNANLAPAWISKDTHGYEKEDWEKWFRYKKANLRDIFELNFLWHRPPNFEMYRTRVHPD